MTVTRNPIGFCSDCQELKKLRARGLCATCYRRATGETARRRTACCIECRRTRIVVGRGRCGACYGRWRRSNLPDEYRTSLARQAARKSRPVDPSALYVSIPVRDYLGDSAYAVLEAIARQPHITHSGVSALVGLTKGTVSQHVQQLIGLGLVRRVRDDLDRRNYRLLIA